jgi:YD repeat-containing protein
MKLTIAFLIISTALYGQGLDQASGGARFDSAGHLTDYVYPDGKTEHYGYDSGWRMTKFVDRNGGVTTFVYRADGSMTVVNPDGSTQNR